VKLIKNLNIDFISHRRKFFAIPILLFILLAVVYFYRGGPNYGIDFEGGIMMQISFENHVDMGDVRNALESAGVESPELQSSEDLFIIRAKDRLQDQKVFETNVMSAMEKAFPGNKTTIEKMEYVGPAVGEYLSQQALKALFFAFLGIIIYVAIRFKSGFWGIAAIAGLLNDVLLSFGFIVLTGKEIDITVITALLTVAGYSINDTIVLFDRMRENLRLNIKEDFGTIINKSINSVLLRTLVTSITVFIVAAALFFLGGKVLHTFAYVMIIGTVLGCYSSIFICAPIVYEWEMGRKRRISLTKKGAAR